MIATQIAGKSLQPGPAKSRRRTPSEPCVFFVEDDSSMRALLARILSAVGFDYVECASGRAALEVIRPDQAGCILIDLQLPDINGLDLHQRLVAKGCRQPFIVITGHSTVASAIRSFHDGALEFFEKPFKTETLVQRVEQALERDRTWRSFQRRIDLLTERELEIVNHIAIGATTKEIAHQLGIAQSTAEVHRYNIMKKMGIDSITELVHLMTKHEL